MHCRARHLSIVGNIREMNLFSVPESSHLEEPRKCRYVSCGPFGRYFLLKISADIGAKISFDVFGKIVRRQQSVAENFC